MKRAILLGLFLGGLSACGKVEENESSEGQKSFSITDRSISGRYQLKEFSCGMNSFSSIHGAYFEAANRDLQKSKTEFVFGENDLHIVGAPISFFGGKSSACTVDVHAKVKFMSPRKFELQKVERVCSRSCKPQECENGPSIETLIEYSSSGGNALSLKDERDNKACVTRGGEWAAASMELAPLR